MEERSLDSASRNWLYLYCSAIIGNKGLYLFYFEKELVGIGESRTWFEKNSSFLGVIVSPAFRLKGIGTFIISYLIDLSLSIGKDIYTSVEANNISSNILMEKLGFDSKYQILTLKLNHLE